MVASMGLPLTFGEDPRFVHFMHKYAQLAYHGIPRTTSHNDVIKCYLNEKQLIIEDFKNHNGIVSMTLDIWTNQSNEPFTCVTSHYIDSNMKLQKKILVWTPHFCMMRSHSMVKSRFILKMILFLRK